MAHTLDQTADSMPRYRSYFDHLEDQHPATSEAATSGEPARASREAEGRRPAAARGRRGLLPGTPDHGLDGGSKSLLLATVLTLLATAFLTLTLRPGPGSAVAQVERQQAELQQAAPFASSGWRAEPRPRIGPAIELAEVVQEDVRAGDVWAGDVRAGDAGVAPTEARPSIEETLPRLPGPEPADLRSPASSQSSAEQSPAEQSPAEQSPAEPAESSVDHPRKDPAAADTVPLGGPRGGDAEMRLVGLPETRPGVRIFAPSPEYPAAAREAGAEGTVLAEAGVDGSGHVTDVGVVRGASPELDLAATDALRQWRFEPAARGGEPIAYRFRQEFRFELEPGKAEELEKPDEVKPPVRLAMPLPTYTDAAWVAGVQGDVLVRATIDERGDVAEVEVLRGLPYGLTEAAVKAVRRWKFRPATRNGDPVVAQHHLSIRFAL